MNQVELLNNVLDNLNKSTLKVPVLKEYQIIEGANNDNLIFAARSEDNSIEQFLIDGMLDENETFEDRLEKVIQETQEELEKNGFENLEIEYLGTLQNNLFQFHLYKQDVIKDGIQIRQLNTYFLEPDGNYFYEVSLAAPPMKKEDVNDNVTNNLYTRIIPIIANINYNDANPLK